MEEVKGGVVSPVVAVPTVGFTMRNSRIALHQPLGRVELIGRLYR